MLVSFIIPHKGREEMLEQTVRSISNQDFDLENVELLIVSQNKEKPSIEGITSKLGRYECLLCDESLTISALRNKGVENSTGEFLAFLDADVDLSSNWISTMLDTVSNNEEVVLSSAMQICPENAVTLEKIRCALSNPDIDVNVHFLPGRNLFLARKTFEQSGGFPEHLVTCEDYYFTDKIASLGKLFYSSKAQYEHLGEDRDYSEFYRKEIWRGQSNLHSLKGRRVPLSELPSFLVPIWILLFTVASLLSLASFQAFEVTMSLIGLTLLPILLYSLRLNKLGQGQFNLANCIKFYLVYFPARIVGTIGGLFKIIKTGQ